MEKKKVTGEVVKLMSHFEKESKRFDRYQIGENEEGIVGTIYIPKGKPAPDSVILSFEK